MLLIVYYWKLHWKLTVRFLFSGSFSWLTASFPISPDLDSFSASYRLVSAASLYSVGEAVAEAAQQRER